MPLIFNVDGTKMSKRDKDKAAKKACRDAKLDASPVASIDGDEFAGWLKDKSRQLSRDQLVELSGAINLTLPEIDVEDFRAAGYLPGVLCNFLALLGWNPGVRDDEGNEVDRFDAAFLAEHFDLARIGKSNAKFDREKLLAFSAGEIQHRMTDGDFGAAWLEWAERFDAELAAWARDDAARWQIAAAAARPRAKTLRDARGAIEYALVSGEAIEHDAKAVKKFLHKGEPSGLAVLGQFRDELGWDQRMDARGDRHGDRGVR